MDEKPKKRRTWLWIGAAALIIAAVLLVLLLGRNKEEEEVIVQPKEEEKVVEPAYDLEKTVRIIVGLLIPPDQMDSFDEYRSYMAHQDYSEVPRDVLEAKEELMPILKELCRIQKEHEEINFWSSLWLDVGSGMIEEMDAETLGMLMLDPGAGGLWVIQHAAGLAFDEYEKTEGLSQELLQELDSVKENYYAFLESFMPVYAKYMDEWNRLCLIRDRAYIALNNRQPEQVIEFCDSVLQNYPENRETLLLKAMGLVQLSRQNQFMDSLRFEKNADEGIVYLKDTLLDEAQKIIDLYLEIYPGQSAPALLLQGLILEYTGEHLKALTYFDQSELWYPKQAKELSDMLNAYRTRNDLYKTASGAKMFNLYKSIMLGSGYFSPDFMEALYYDEKGDLEKCSKAIYDHFFRRGNQDVYDGLLTDMYFCEELMPNSFKRLMPERNYINVSFDEHRTGWFNQTKHHDIIDVKVDNQANIEITNLRVFLCIQFTDMKDYHVVKLPTIEWLPIHGSDTVNGVEIGFQEKGIDNIANMRAIGMTDDKIFWIDNVYNAKIKRDYNEDHVVNVQKLMAMLDSIDVDARDSYLEAIRISDTMFRNNILNYSHVSLVKGKRDKCFVEIDLPLELTLLSPTFSWESNKEYLMPVNTCLQGNYIHLSFEVYPTIGDKNVVYMTSDYLNYVIRIKYDLDYGTKAPKLEVVSVKPMKKK